MKQLESVLSADGLKVFDINARASYNTAYDLSGSRLSNSCFLHRVCWNALFSYSYQIVGKAFCLVADDNKVNSAHIVYPLGSFSDNELREILRYWRGIFTACNKPLRIEFVEKKDIPRLIMCMENTGLKGHITPCRDCFDYVYDISDYLELGSKRNRWKRHLWNKYNSSANRYHIEQIGVHNIEACRQITNIWESQKGILDTDLLNTDHIPLDYFWQHFDEIENTSYVLYRDEKPVAFFVASVHAEYCTFHFAKSDRTCPEANFLLHHVFLSRYKSQDIKILNFEDDMGEIGVRIYKSRIAPSKMLEKYSVEVKV